VKDGYIDSRVFTNRATHGRARRQRRRHCAGSRRLQHTCAFPMLARHEDSAAPMDWDRARGWWWWWCLSVVVEGGQSSVQSSSPPVHDGRGLKNHDHVACPGCCCSRHLRVISSPTVGCDKTASDRTKAACSIIMPCGHSGLRRRQSQLLPGYKARLSEYCRAVDTFSYLRTIPCYLSPHTNPPSVKN
jgi:hypothetical protein